MENTLFSLVAESYQLEIRLLTDLKTSYCKTPVPRMGYYSDNDITDKN